MTGNRTSSRAGRAVAAAACALAMGVVAAPAAEAAPVAAPAAAVKGTCGAPELKAWYDSDQFGTYLKVWFKTAKGCKKGRKIANFSGDIYCVTTKKRVYRVNVASKKAPYSTVIKGMPPKNKCKQFWATSTIVYSDAKRTPFKDTWRWNWGDHPA
jgi:hypothetical protein